MELRALVSQAAIEPTASPVLAFFSMRPLVAGRKGLPGLKEQLSDATGRENGETCTRGRCAALTASSRRSLDATRRDTLRSKRPSFLDQIELGLRRQLGAADKHFDQGRKADRSEEEEGKPVAASFA